MPLYGLQNQMRSSQTIINITLLLFLMSVIAVKGGMCQSRYLLTLSLEKLTVSNTFNCFSLENTISMPLFVKCGR